MNTLALRLGNTNTTAFVVSEGLEHPWQVQFEDGSTSLPTAVAIHRKTGQKVVGRKALDLQLQSPADVAVGFFQALGTDTRFRLGDVDYSASALVALVAAEVRRAAEMATSRAIGQCVLCVPVTFDVPQTTDFCTALASAGIRVAQRVPTPVAEVLGMPQNDLHRRIMVVRMGGHALEITIVSRNSPLRLAWCTGLSNCAGTSIDRNVADWFLQRLRERGEGEVYDDETGRLRLLREAERAKIELSSQDRTRINLLSGGRLVSAELRRPTFEELTEPILQRAGDLAADTMGQPELRGQTPETLLLTGGCAQIPRLQRILEAKTGLAPVILPNCDAVAALGAAESAIRSGLTSIESGGGKPTTADGQATPRLDNQESGPVLEGAAQAQKAGPPCLSFGISIDLGQSGSAPVFAKGTPLPAANRLSFFTSAPVWPRQTREALSVTLIEDGAASTDPCREIGHWVLLAQNLLNELPARSPIDLHIQVDENQDVRVTAIIPQSGLAYDLQREGPSRIDRVHFSVACPPAVQPSSAFCVDVWAHLEQQRAEVERLVQQSRPEAVFPTMIRPKGPFKIERGTSLVVRLKFDEFHVEPAEDVISWEGEIGNASFAVNVPAGIAAGTKNGWATVHWEGGLQIARVTLPIVVNAQMPPALPTMHPVRHIRNAFASYASEDRRDVLTCIQGMQKQVPELKVFYDEADLRSGTNWEQELKRIIPQNDIFYLFWSADAKASPWVEMEWRCALNTRGIQFIDPVPLVSPDEVPPPDELGGKHFKDWVLAYKRGKPKG